MKRPVHILSSLKRFVYIHWQKGPFKIAGLISAICLIIYFFLLPDPLFDDPYSTVLEDRNGELLGARIALDGQWRFPPRKVVPEKFEKAILAFEDKRFHWHPGVDPIALGRAFYLNVRHGEVRSGGSTLSMQVIRLARKGKSRTYWEKIIEIFLATRLEWTYSKNEILALYASHAPFGGNIVGLDAASWKYFGRNADQLSWAEAATLAVLPNAPGLIHPGRNRESLKIKRDFLLDLLEEDGILDSTSAYLARLERLPDKPKTLPAHAPHLLEGLHQSALKGSLEEQIVQSTLNANIQIQAKQIVQEHYERLRQNEVNNIAALVVSVADGEVMAYIGNSPCKGRQNGCAVDIIQSKRSTGSILKPFLFAAMLTEGEILPHSLVPDVPTNFEQFRPQNYIPEYSGAVPASRALSRSLNIPAVYMLRKYGVGKFQAVLNQIGISSIDRPADDYGLTLILGGAEASLWEITGAYAAMAHNLLQSRSASDDKTAAFKGLQYIKANDRKEVARKPGSAQSVFTPSAIWQTFTALEEVNRPEGEQNWQQFSSSRRVAWKTGTSFGYRDAWAVGCTPEYIVGVWVGNADGEGRDGLLGVEAAAPIMFDIFNRLSGANNWFERPDEMEWIQICRQSGHQISENCPDPINEWIGEIGHRSSICPYHKSINLDASGRFRVHSDCENPLNMQQEPFFILPPRQEMYYRNRNPEYRPLPVFRSDCRQSAQLEYQAMDLIYPEADTRILVPRKLDGSLSKTVFSAAHRDPNAIIFWHLDTEYIGQTREIHQMSLQPGPGIHTISLVDDAGTQIRRRFEILEKDQQP